MPLKFGFELETQATLGRRYEDYFEADLEDLPAHARLVMALLKFRLAGFEVKDDGSVDGFEFATRGGLSWRTVLKRAAFALQRKWRHHIDRECAFHIHVSGPGVPTSYLPDWQYWCMEYLAANRHRVPARVRERWEDGDAQRFFGVELFGGKGPFVSYRCETWEFRCWGNITTEKDAKRALLLTREAVEYAIARLELEAPSLLGMDAFTDRVQQLRRMLLDGETRRHVAA